MKSLKQITKILADWFKQHAEINSVYTAGNLDLKSKDNIVYPFASIQPDDPRFDGDLITYSFRVVLGDILCDDNEFSSLEIENSLLQIANDFITELDENEDFDINTNVSIEFFEDDFTDRCCGLVFFLSVSQFRVQNACAIPKRTLSTSRDPSFQAVLDYAIGRGYSLPSQQYLDALNLWIVEQKSSGVFDKDDVLYNFAHDGDVDFKTINYMNPAKHKATVYGGITSSILGFKGNGIDGYIDTNFNAFVDGKNYSLDNASRTAVVFDLGEAGTSVNLNNIDGMDSLNNNRMINVLQQAQRINMGQTSLSYGIDFSGLGFTQLNRLDAANVVGYKRDVKTNSAAPSTAIDSANQLVFKSNIAYGRIGVSLYAIGTSYSESEAAAKRQSFNSYLTRTGQTPFA